MLSLRMSYNRKVVDQRSGGVQSVDDLMTPQSIEGHVFHDFEMHDGKTASALNRIITNKYFRRRINVEKQHAQRTRQISTRQTDF